LEEVDRTGGNKGGGEGPLHSGGRRSLLARKVVLISGNR